MLSVRISQSKRELLSSLLCFKCNWIPLVLTFACGALVQLRAGEAPVERGVNSKVIMGWLESVYIKPYGIRVTAKLDTGAKTSSVHASQIEHFSRDGREWVRFSFNQEEGKKHILIERPLVRTAVIKERQSKSSTRDVVMLTVCKNGKDYDTEFTLNDRSNFNYPILLGRSFLENLVLVDSSETFLFKSESDACSDSFEGGSLGR